MMPRAHQEGMERLIIHIIGDSGESRAGHLNKSNMTPEDIGKGRAGARVPRHEGLLGLTLASTKGGGGWSFLSACLVTGRGRGEA